MSQYTICPRAYISIIDKSRYNSSTFADYDKKIELGRDIFFNFDYGTDSEFKELFERTFLNTYFESDIYCNDIRQFMNRLKTDVRASIAPYYRLYKKIKEDIDILQTAAFRETVSESGSDKGESVSSGNGKNKSLGSNFPNDIENATEFSDVKFMNSGSMGENSSEASSSAVNTRESSRTVEHVEEGGNILDRITELQKLSFNVIESAVKSFNYLFLGVW